MSKVQCPMSKVRRPMSDVAVWMLVSLCLLQPGCTADGEGAGAGDEAASMVNFDHLDHLGEPAGPDAEARIIHIYSEAPDYGWVGDDDEGIAAVDDAARAAVVYLRAFELNGDEDARLKAEALIRFILYMQRSDGLFYNFVWNSELDINTQHANSTADEFEWWACRAVWALGVAANVLKAANPELSRTAAGAIELARPHLSELLENYPVTVMVGGRHLPTWLVHQNAADATSELLLGLVALRKAYPDPGLDRIIDRFAEGMAMMQWGDMDTFPYAAHGSWREGWHAWGNSQTQALAQVPSTETAIREARSFYSRLLVEGWLHSFEFGKPTAFRRFEQIAYGVRCVAVGLIRLYEATGDRDYLIMAGLAASWFTGNNVGGFQMYDPETGRGYDGIGGPDFVNRNAGAESTIESLFTIQEIERYPESNKWLFARGRDPKSEEINGARYIYRMFTIETDSLALVMNLTDHDLKIARGSEFVDFFSQ